MAEVDQKVNMAPSLGLVFGVAAGLLVSLLTDFSIHITTAVGGIAGLVVGSMIYTKYFERTKQAQE